MLISLGSNINSIRAQRQLANSTQEISTVFERLASGQRINRASDDAAGLAVAQSLNASTRIFNQAVRNLNDGISLVSIADSAIENLTNIVTRIEELAAQSANGTFSSQQRHALDREAQALSREFTRIMQSTSYNGLGLLNGEIQDLALQGGVGLDAILQMGSSRALGSGAFTSTSVSFGDGQLVGDLNGDGFADIVNNSSLAVRVAFGNGDGTFDAPITIATGSYQIAVGDLNNDGQLDLMLESGTTITTYMNNGNGSFSLGPTSTVSAFITSPQLGDVNGDGNTDIVGWRGNQLVTVFGQGNGSFGAETTMALTGVTAIEVADLNNDGVPDVVAHSQTGNWASSFLGNGNGTFTLRSSLAFVSAQAIIKSGDVNGDGILDVVITGSNIRAFLGDGQGGLTAAGSVSIGGLGSIYDFELGDINGDGLDDMIVNFDTDSLTNVYLATGAGQFSISQTIDFGFGSGPTDLSLGDLNSDGILDAFVGKSSGNASVLLNTPRNGVNPILDFSLGTQADARQALPLLQRKRQLLASQRSQFGAYLARLNTAQQVLSTSAENFAAAESRIRDADVAAESSRAIRLQILQQTASAVLAQANQQPAIAISLLRTDG